ncbi:MAG: hypothetical protein DYH02_16830 [Candidatus Omnitrophica bacterium COP1]|nr:hypothetical protein [Candidatus Omnitrophica bacterium COP1]
MGLMAVYPKPRASIPDTGHKVYLKDYADVWEAEREIGAYFAFYNRERPHQSLGNRTPEEVWSSG